MAVPGKIDSPLSKGTHQLLKQGAKLLESVEDVTEGLGFIGLQLQPHVTDAAAKASQIEAKPLFDAVQLKLGDTEKTIYDCLSKEPLHIDQIIDQTDLPAGSINAGLISLQLKGLVKQLPGSLFLKK